MRRSPRLFAVLLAMLVAACAEPAPAPLPVSAMTPRSTYQAAVHVQLGLRPAAGRAWGSVFAQGAPGRHGAVLVIHGGGWVSGSRAYTALLCNLLAARGLVVFSIDYRLANFNQADTRWPAQLEDSQRALQWLRSHAQELSVDTRRIAVAGDSSGAHLAIMLAVSGGGPRVAAVLDQFGPTDLATLPQWVNGSYWGLFGTGTPSPQAVQDMSPAARGSRPARRRC